MLRSASPRCVLLAVLACAPILGPTPAPALGAAGAAGTPAVERAARAFARATLTFTEERRAAGAKAQRNADARRWAGGTCLDVWRAAPAALREELFAYYFVSVSGGLWETDAPLFERWLRRLRAIRGVSQIAPLRAARAVLSADMALADRIYRAVPDVCGPATAWMAAGWRADRRPAVFARLRLADVGSSRDAARDRRRVLQARRLLQRRAGRAGRLAAHVLADRVDEPDARVIKRCDPVVAVLDALRAECPSR